MAKSNNKRDRALDLVLQQLKSIGITRTEWTQKLNAEDLVHAYEAQKKAFWMGANHWAARIDIEDDARDQIIDAMAEEVGKLRELLPEAPITSALLELG